MERERPAHLAFVELRKLLWCRLSDLSQGRKEGPSDMIYLAITLESENLFHTWNVLPFDDAADSNTNRIDQALIRSQVILDVSRAPGDAEIDRVREIYPSNVVKQTVGGPVLTQCCFVSPETIQPLLFLQPSPVNVTGCSTATVFHSGGIWNGLWRA